MFTSQTISVADVLEVESALRSLVRAQYPDIEVGEGSALNSVVIKALGYLAAAIKADSDSIKRRMYLPDLEKSLSSDSAMLLEDLASNFLVSTEAAIPKRGLVDFTFSSAAGNKVFKNWFKYIYRHRHITGRGNTRH